MYFGVQFAHLPHYAPLTSARLFRSCLIYNSRPCHSLWRKLQKKEQLPAQRRWVFCSLPCLVLAAIFFVPWPRNGRPMVPVRSEVNPHAADGYSISAQPAGISTTTTIYTMTGTY